MGKLTAAAVAAALVLPGVSGLFLGGGLTILSRNDLDGAENNGTGAALLVHQPSPYSAAQTACALLGEEPWDPARSDFNAALNRSLAYQVYQKISAPGQIYWIAKTTPDADTCRGIDTSGAILSLACTSEVPALCTQSAPVSNSTLANASAAWQVSHFVGNKQLTGYRDYHTFKFRGIRFAPTPARFTYSTPASFEAPGEVDATSAGADCSQPIGEVKSGSSEDCLFANVWTPYLPRMGDSRARVRTHLKPVMVYLYGGGMSSGSGKNPNTDGTNLASHGDVVVVSVNYRVGTIGFLNLNDGVHKGNYAISDMLSALQWVNKYIEYFGGDPDRVTLFGESAGAMGTHIMLGVAQAEGLFHRAITQSNYPGGPPDGKMSAFTSYDSLQNNYNSTTKKVLRAAGCLDATDVVACLGKYSGFDLVNMTTNANGIVVDGTYLTYHELVVNQTAGGHAANVSVMFGVNRDDAGIDVDANAFPTTNTTLAAWFTSQIAKPKGMPANAASLLGLDDPSKISIFTSRTPPTQNKTLPYANATLTPDQILSTSIRIATDAVFACHNQAMLYSASKHATFASSYFFTFNRTYQTSGYTRPWCVPPKTALRPDGDPDGEYMKCHAGEQMVVFGTERRAGRPDRDGLDVPFMQLVGDYWAAFARTGDPNPEREWLVARGHWNTLGQVEKTGRWETVDWRAPTGRVLQWDGVQAPFSEGAVCKALGAPVDVFEVAS
ncbi:Carboxylesterase family-domain-containing protein [Lasiosphaeris hirsuta]|uniref:Carboxylesterase family-domain-containing protein n=1 Tax=Lasiosphaeris hirsuta TaxID=260670 RepID=A0AA40AGE2_9PEZI|nr:Carboxylesterase family-domain-containing protein [Lasiosphaeris hirsuta]